MVGPKTHELALSIIKLHITVASQPPRCMGPSLIACNEVVVMQLTWYVYKLSEEHFRVQRGGWDATDLVTRLGISKVLLNL